MPRRRPPKRVRKAFALKKQREIARERLEILAKQVAETQDAELARKWVRLIVKISRRWKVPIPKSLKGRFCYNCYRYWVPGKTVTLRVKKKKPVMICACGEEYPAKQKVFKA